MDKLIGMLLILFGCAGMLYHWYERQRRRQRTIAAFFHLFTSWEYCLMCQKVRLKDFLAQYTGREPQIQVFLAGLLEAVETCRYPSGDELWRQALGSGQVMLDLDAELLELLLPAGEAFFGTNQRENIQCAHASGERLRERLAQERAQFSQKQKVYLPVGMLGGVLLVIFLL